MRYTHCRSFRLGFMVCLLLLIPGLVWAAESDKWWEVIPEEENPSPYYDSILYSEIPPLLHELEQESDRVHVRVMGQSAGGRDLFLVTIADGGENGPRLGYYKQIRKLMRTNPEAAQALLETKDIKVPVFINGSIHGDEYTGTDACIRLIRRFAHYDSPAIRRILDHVILLINVVQNPDGRVLGTRRNGAGFDLNRDFLTLAQPESRATVDLVREWNPLVFLDLHGFVNPMLIEPCTPPHMASAEYDLFIKWALPQAEAMEAELLAQTGYSAQIPFRDHGQQWAWDDWSPSYAGVYTMLPGSYGHTLETPYRDERGVDAHYATMWGALNFIVQNKTEMLADQIAIYRRGLAAESQQLIPQEILDRTPHAQYNELSVAEFPSAYILPANAPLQKDPHACIDLLELLMTHGVEISRASAEFVHNGVTYPAGTYVVWMNQPKRAVANTILADGPDLSDVEGGLVFYSPPSSWSVPLLWDVSRIVVEGPLAAATQKLYRLNRPDGEMPARETSFLAWQPGTIAAYQAANLLLDKGFPVYRATAGFQDKEQAFETGTFIIPIWELSADLPAVLSQGFKLDLHSLGSVPENAILLKDQAIAISEDPALAYCLDALGFDYEMLTDDHINMATLADIDRYDLFINSAIYWHVDPETPYARYYDALDDNGKAVMTAFLESGGDYIGFYDVGCAFALEAGAVAAAISVVEDHDGIIAIDYDAAHPVGAGYGHPSHAFVYGPTWFDNLGQGVSPVATVGTGEFFVSGYWPGWRESGAAGMPIIVHGQKETQDTILMGIDPAFRGHPRGSFPVIANAIFSCLD